METYEIPVKVKEALDHLDQAKNLMSNGSLDYYLRKMCEHSEALLTKFAPLCVGDEAIIVGTIECKDGWKGSEKHLAKGVGGVVQDVDYVDGRFVVDFVPHKQWWKNGEGKWMPKDRNHSYHLRADKLLKVQTENE